MEAVSKAHAHSDASSCPWVRSFDPAKRAHYYYNVDTGRVTYTEPDEFRLDKDMGVLL